MTGPPAADKSLLDRLNALKPSSVSLGTPSQTAHALRSVTEAPVADIDRVAVAGVGSAAPPPATREEALAARLRTLRQQADSPYHPAPHPRDEAAAHDRRHVGHDPNDLPVQIDEQALNDVLLDLAATGLGDEDADTDNGADSIVQLPDVPAGDRIDDAGGDGAGEDDGDTEQVEALLKSVVSPAAWQQHLLARAGCPDGGDGRLQGKEAAPRNSSRGNDSDDSDGDDMSRAVSRVLAQARDEAALQQKDDDNHGDDDEEANNAPFPQRERRPPKDDTGDADNGGLRLPAVPTTFVDPPHSADNDGGGDGGGDDDDSISARLAALRGLCGPATGLATTDAFGLPSAPTFQPGDSTTAGQYRLRGPPTTYGRHGYTDADMQTWCIVCLEDATVRCLGCADDGGGGGTRMEDDDDGGTDNAYCERCWRAMHVGPAAGFDERGHKRVPLVRRMPGGT
ncbi:hypothetical protein SPI_04297 [Niveomyces insectorum RCEF 264]|uniref:Uncharacterized protein n=1 Tax=Niveomyces insectorum RCEF 264 TaxID=1081102 RepID=A0A167VLH4_9HYPO|nr:hypothetical protein SPI_04297 [Niveomyces insectorum RCEF 264]